MVLTVDEAKQHLRIDYDEEDELIEKLILQAQAAAEDRGAAGKKDGISCRLCTFQ